MPSLKTMLVVVLPSVLAVVHAPGAVTPVAAQAAKSWQFGQYRQFTPPATRSADAVTSRTAAPGLKLSRVAVQRPQVAPGDTANLIAEYEVSVPQEETMEVKETRIIRFDGQQVATLEKIVSVPRGPAGSTVTLKIPTDAAPGLYTITTMIEPRSAVGTRSLPRAGTEDRANSMFRVEVRAAAPSAPPATPAPSTPPAASTPPAPAAGSEPSPQLKLWTDATQHKIGDKAKVFFQANRDGYVTLVNVGTSGKITILFPNAYSPSHAVKGGQTYSVPGADDPYELTLGGPEGVELVYALFTLGSTRFVEESFIRDRAFAPVNDKAEIITRDINVTAKRIPLKEQANAALEIEVTR